MQDEHDSVTEPVFRQRHQGELQSLHIHDRFDPGTREDSGVRPFMCAVLRLCTVPVTCRRLNYTVLWIRIRIRSDAKLFAGSGYGSELLISDPDPTSSNFHWLK